MTLTGIISAIGNNNSVYPLIVRDCGIEVPSKIALTYNQNKKESKEILLWVKLRIILSKNRATTLM